MDIIDNYNRLTLGQYMEIQEISRNESLEDIDKQVQIISILTGVAEDEILHLPIPEYKELVARSAFLNHLSPCLRSVSAGISVPDRLSQEQFCFWRTSGGICLQEILQASPPVPQSAPGLLSSCSVTDPMI